MKATAIIVTAFAIFNQSAHADGLPPRSAYPPPPQPSQSCLMTALPAVKLPTPTPKPASPSPARAVSCCRTMPPAITRLPAITRADETHRPIRGHPACVRHGSIGATNHDPRCQRAYHWHGEH
jgi:hypothetical protein